MSTNDDEVKRLVRGLEAFAHAAGVSPAAFVEAVQAIATPGAVAHVPATSPYRTAAAEAATEPEVKPNAALYAMLKALEANRFAANGGMHDVLCDVHKRLGILLYGEGR